MTRCYFRVRAGALAVVVGLPLPAVAQYINEEGLREVARSEAIRLAVSVADEPECGPDDEVLEADAVRALRRDGFTVRDDPGLPVLRISVVTVYLRQAGVCASSHLTELDVFRSWRSETGAGPQYGVVLLASTYGVITSAGSRHAARIRETLDQRLSVILSKIPAP